MSNCHMSKKCAEFSIGVYWKQNGIDCKPFMNCYLATSHITMMFLIVLERSGNLYSAHHITKTVSRAIFYANCKHNHFRDKFAKEKYRYWELVSVRDCHTKRITQLDLSASVWVFESSHSAMCRQKKKNIPLKKMYWKVSVCKRKKCKFDEIQWNILCKLVVTFSH